MTAMILLRGGEITVLLAYLSVALIYVLDLRSLPNVPIIRLSCLGQLTYSLYMLHPLFQTILLNVVATRFLGLTGLPLTLFSYGVMLALVFASYASLVWFEMPARRLVRKALSQRDAATA